MMFEDRADAGRQLARAVDAYRHEAPVVLGLPRGGVPVAFEVARRLRAPLDVILVRKLGVPFQPELAVGAVGEDGVVVVNRDVLASTRITDDQMHELERAGRAELESRAQRLRGTRPRVSLEDRLALVVDDGVATGATARAACQVARAHGARAVVLAVPVASSRTVADMKRELDDMVCLDTPYPFWAVGQVYRDFGQVDDAEVVALLDRATWAPDTPDAPEPVRDPGPGTPREVLIPAPGAPRPLAGILDVPTRPRGLVAFAHGSGSSRLSPRNRRVAQVLGDAGLGTLLLDLLTDAEEGDRSLVFDIEFLARRLVATCTWLREQPGCRGLPLGLFGASTGAAAALVAATDAVLDVSAVVSRGGRPDLAAGHLARVRAPTLLIVGGHDQAVLQLNRHAQERLEASSLVVVPGATHLFEEPGALERVAALARDWFLTHLTPSVETRAPVAGRHP
ncbi:phosphoribosyltransferase family protein [Nocardioides koreensis]|uniref:Phosphoribosyltransferase family protein n=1 Tax=Nocardioides koreensis TaxID=433651 RepID=A0ABP5LQW1_9ACTN